jgi:hypothetical protein
VRGSSGGGLRRGLEEERGVSRSGGWGGGAASCLRPAAATVCGDMLVLVESSEIDAGYVAHVPRHGVLAQGSGLRVVLNTVWHALEMEMVRKNDL